MKQPLFQHLLIYRSAFDSSPWVRNPVFVPGGGTDRHLRIRPRRWRIARPAETRAKARSGAAFRVRNPVFVPQCGKDRDLRTRAGSCGKARPGETRAASGLKTVFRVRNPVFAPGRGKNRDLRTRPWQESGLAYPSTARIVARVPARGDGGPCTRTPKLQPQVAVIRLKHPANR